MARRKKGQVRKGHGIMCNICGLNCGKGGALSKHVHSAHGIEYDDYRAAFYGDVKCIIADSWDDSVKTTSGKTVVTHVLVRRFINEPGHRGATRAARVAK